MAAILFQDADGSTLSFKYRPYRLTPTVRDVTPTFTSYEGFAKILKTMTTFQDVRE